MKLIVGKWWFTAGANTVGKYGRGKGERNSGKGTSGTWVGEQRGRKGTSGTWVGELRERERQEHGLGN